MTDNQSPEEDSSIPNRPSEGDSRVEPIFLDEPIEASSDELVQPKVRPPRKDRPPCWYCGLGEAFLWFIGTFIVQILAGIPVAIVVILVTVLRTGHMSPDMLEDKMPWIIGWGEFLFVLATILAIVLRLWGRSRAELNFSPPEWKHVLLVAGATLPLALWVSVWSEPIQVGWTNLVEMYPGLGSLDELSSMKLIKDLSEKLSLPMMFLCFAVFPAVGEEIIFRGAIGRALIANMGLWAGVLITSFLFAWCHVHPVHALAVMPVGLALHYVYLTTRSFWVPMLLHFMNNCWAVALLKFHVHEPEFSEGKLNSLDVVELIAAAAAVIATAVVLCRSRIRYIQADGQEYRSVQFPLRVPDVPDVHRQSASMGFVWSGIAIAGILVCHLALAVNHFRSLQQAG